MITNTQISSCLILMKLEFSRQIFETYPNVTPHENPSSGSPVTPCGQTDTMQLTVPFHNFVNAPKNGHYYFKKFARIEILRSKKRTSEGKRCNMDCLKQT